MLWVLPCSALGVLFGLLVMALGGTARRVDHTLEFALVDREAQLPSWAHRLAYAAVTLGHVIIGQSHETLAHLRCHERVHVAQYELLGPLFFVAYPGASLLAWCRGMGPYRGNYFERQAFAQGPSRTHASSGRGSP